jgi:glycosyltransferase involved in cell wall biosynthesis
MRVLQYYKTDFLKGGGGGIAMFRLHQKLRDLDVDSNILCKNKTTSSKFSSIYEVPKMITRIENLIKRVTIPFGLNDIHAISSFTLLKNIAVKSSDILHLHGVHGNFFSYLSLPALTKELPTVFTLHDMWAYTGHCAYSYNCERWKTGCGKCPYPENHPPIKRDSTHIEWILKKKIYEQSRLCIIALSKEQVKQVRNSILRGFPIHHIPNGVDTNEYFPIEKGRCRHILNIPHKKNVILFAALNLKQHNKGSDLLIRAINSLPKNLRSNLFILTIGSSGDELKLGSDIPILNLGFIQNDRLKAVAFSAADIFVSPTRAEAFGLVVLESMACATPVVAFGVGGILDLIKHRDTGYIAEPENHIDLARGIEELLTDADQINLMGEKSRKVSIEKFSIERQAKKHIELYRQLLH